MVPHPPRKPRVDSVRVKAPHGSAKVVPPAVFRGSFAQEDDVGGFLVGGRMMYRDDL